MVPPSLLPSGTGPPPSPPPPPMDWAMMPNALAPVVVMLPFTLTATVPPLPVPPMTVEPSAFTPVGRSEEHTSELQSLMRISYAVFCLKKKNSTSYPPLTTALANNIQHIQDNLSYLIP